MLTARIDYLDFSVPVEKFYEYAVFLGTTLHKLEVGFRGYKEKHLLGNGGFAAKSNNRSDCHYSLSGSVLSNYIEDYSRLHALFSKILGDGGNISRIDVAVDVTEELPFKTVEDSIGAGEMVSKARKVKIVESLANDSGKLLGLGKTIYLGSSKSNKMLRIYDKGKEQGTTKDWVRFELQLRNEDAYAYVRHIVNSDKMCVVDNAVSLVVSYVDFRNLDNKNVSRRTRCSWYDSIVGAYDKIVLVFEKKLRTMTSIVSWIERQVSPSMAMLKKYYGESYHSIFNYLLFCGNARLKEKHFNILANCAIGV